MCRASSPISANNERIWQHVKGARPSLTFDVRRYSRHFWQSPYSTRFTSARNSLSRVKQQGSHGNHHVYARLTTSSLLS